MSDYEDDWDDDYYDDYYFEDELLEADDPFAAQVTIPSPAILAYDPSLDLKDIFSDWEYYTDDFYDDAGVPTTTTSTSTSTKHPKQNSKRKHQHNSIHHHSKRRKLTASSSDIPPLSLSTSASSSPEPELGRHHRQRKPLADTVKFKRRAERAREAQLEPVSGVGRGEIALLPDWRERLDWPRRDRGEVEGGGREEGKEAEELYEEGGDKGDDGGDSDSAGEDIGDVIEVKRTGAGKGKDGGKTAPKGKPTRGKVGTGQLKENVKEVKVKTSPAKNTRKRGRGEEPPPQPENKRVLRKRTKS